MKTKHLKPNKWKDLRAEISNAIREHHISETDFHSLSPHENFNSIEEKIYQTFCTLSHPLQRPIWLWEYFKLESYSVSNFENRPETYLDKLIEPAENVWMMINENIGNGDKFWFYEGKIKAIKSIINETGFDELYLISKKYDWLICINHHDDLIATGKLMTEKLKETNIK